MSNPAPSPSPRMVEVASRAAILLACGRKITPRYAIVYADMVGPRHGMRRVFSWTGPRPLKAPRYVLAV